MEARQRGVVYFNLGTKCLTRLAVSLFSLRQHYDGEVAILSGGGDEGICGRLARAAGATAFAIPIKQLRKHTAYCAKSTLPKHSPYETTVFLDADTTVHGDFSLLFDAAERTGLCVTRFSNWVSTGRMVSGRIRKWEGVKCPSIDVEELIRLNLDEPHAAINTGVLAWRKDSSFVADWEKLTYAGWHCPFTDELACQLLVRKHKHTVVDCRFNWSAVYPNGDSVVIAHQHGSKCLRECWQPYWLPLFREVWKQDFGGIQSWMPEDDREKYREYV